ncbi:alpha/beta hydrolase [Staphylococcus gallinarum]|uniref:alpha/beta hydrolase n=1 Tax=Staphylococcus gallinarum TaxID=1293 RepID=UPI00244331AE|nr:alpha/beta hydrolase [Staphylococcus gallinarum]
MTVKTNYIFNLSESITRKNIKFKNRFGIILSADIYLPAEFDENKHYPGIIIGPPYSGVKEQGPGIYAQELAKKGYVTLAFDPSFNGNSGGDPRHVSSPDIFVEDFSAAVDYIGTRKYIDKSKIAAIGICGSGGFALSAAQIDPRIKAVITTSMVDISEASKMSPLEQRKKEMEEIAELRYNDFLSEDPILGPRGSALQIKQTNDPAYNEFGEFYSTERGYHPRSITQFTLSSTLSFMNFSLLDHINTISPRPIMLIVGKEAFSKQFSKNAYNEANEPKYLIEVENANHIDLYDDITKIPFDEINEFLINVFK